MDKSYIKKVCQDVLNINFKIKEKRRIVDHHDRIQFACPYCGDSTRTITAKRGNIYFNKLIFVCFNCGKKSGFDRFAKDFSQQIDPDKKLEIIEYLDKNITYKDYEDEVFDTSFEKLIDLSEIERIFNSGDFAITDFKPIQKDSPVHSYLISRGISSNKHRDIYQAKYWYNESRYDPIMCFLNRKGNKVLGAQVRNLKEGKRRMFKIYNFENLYKWVNSVEEIEDIEINQIVVYNKLSYYFNILNVDFSNMVTIFEGYLDSLFYPNSIGVVGVNTDFNFLENNNLEIQYFFDNDITGYQKSEEKLRDGFMVFLWKKLFENIVFMKKGDDPYKLMYRISKIKDLNKLAELVPDPCKKLKLQNFFSKDILDIKYIPKKEKKYYRKVS